MNNFIVVVPKQGNLYIDNFSERLNSGISGGECSFYSIFKCSAYKGRSFTAYMLYENYDDCLNYDFQSNKTCEIEIYEIDHYDRKNFFGYSKGVANHIIENINKRNLT
jgi:hypothetical protein